MPRFVKTGRLVFVLALVTVSILGGASVTAQIRPAHADHNAVIHTLEEVIRQGYHDETAGNLIADEIARRRAAGRYVTRGPADEFAALLTGDLVEISNDPHFLVRYDSSTVAGAVPGRGGRPEALNFDSMPIEEAEFWRSVAYGIEGLEWLEGNIGRLDIRAFARPYPEVRLQYARAMDFLRYTDALIIDLTDNGGGSVHMVGNLLGYFFSRPSFLTKTIEWRTEGREIFMTPSSLDGSSYGEERPIVIAVSEETFSGGEELAYSLQAFGRAVIVGQRTRGGANPVATWELGEGFRVIVPTGRVTHPVTGGNWEGSGVVPDILVPADRILPCAHATALRLVAERAENDGETFDVMPEQLRAACVE